MKNQFLLVILLLISGFYISAQSESDFLHTNPIVFTVESNTESLRLITIKYGHVFTQEGFVARSNSTFYERSIRISNGVPYTSSFGAINIPDSELASTFANFAAIQNKVMILLADWLFLRANDRVVNGYSVGESVFVANDLPYVELLYNQLSIPIYRPPGE